MGTATSTNTRADPPAAGPLVDPQGRVIDYLRVSVTDRCNYRCTYCMPAEGVPHSERSDVLSFEEIAAIVGAFVRLGVRRVRLTGGEPTVRRDLVALVRLLRPIPGLEDLALSTNGERLGALAAPLRGAGVDRLNVSLDSLDPDRFAAITRGGDLPSVLAGLEAARAAGFRSIKINTVAVRGFNDDELATLCRFSWDRGFLPRFIEQMPMSDGRLFVPGTLLGAAEIRARLEAAFARPDAPARLSPDEGAARGGGPARYLRLEGGTAAGAAGRPRLVGIISPLTEHFCDTCNRLRLSSAGALHTCLGHDDATELRPILRARGEAGLLAAIRRAVAGKRAGHTFGLVGLGGPRKAMVQIGG